MKKIIKITESELIHIVKKIILEQNSQPLRAEFWNWQYQVSSDGENSLGIIEIKNPKLVSNIVEFDFNLVGTQDSHKGYYNCGSEISYGEFKNPITLGKIRIPRGRQNMAFLDGPTNYLKNFCKV